MPAISLEPMSSYLSANRTIGVNALIKCGAGVVENAEDILNELGSFDDVVRTTAMQRKAPGLPLSQP